jgi:hypothetical protein
MTLIIPPGFADIAIEIRNSGDPDPWYITFGIDISENDDPVVIGGQMQESFVPIMQMMAANSRNTGIKVTVGQDGADPVRYFRAVDGSEGGGSSGPAKLPQNCAALVRKNTALGGRKGRGRFFLPNVLDEAEVSEVGVLSSALVAVVQGKVTDMFGVLLNGDPPYPMVLLHNGIEGGDAPDPTPVTSLSVSNILSTQRRRLR